VIRTPIAAWCWRSLPLWGKRVILWLFNTHFIVGSAAVVHDADGRVLVARHTYRTHTPWALPGGWVRRGENPAEAVVREIHEETTLDVEILAPLTVQMESPVHLTVIYGARLIGGTFRPSAEVAEVQFLEPGIWPEGLREDHRAILEVFGWRPVRDHTIA
jgi:ADP-ribose pyrophosphatase YjhB (NUDIX family)